MLQIYMAKMVNASFAYLFTPLLFWYANVPFTIFATYLLISIYIFVTFMQLRSEFVQIYLILSMLNSSCIACILGAGKAP